MPRVRQHLRRKQPPLQLEASTVKSGEQEQEAAKVFVVQPGGPPLERKPTIGEQVRSVLAVPGKKPKPKPTKTKPDVMAEDADKLADSLESMGG